MMSEQTRSGKQAVVIGASMAGLLAARALADHFEQVTLLERDTFPPPGTNRKGVPQGKHTHVLLELGRQIMEDYLPGLTDELTRLGAVTITDVSLNVRWFHSGGYHQPGVSGISGVGVSRPSLEAAVRARVLALPNVRAIEGCKAVGLVTAADKGQDNGRVTGVRLVRGQAGSVGETLMADLVVDASGRGSRSPVWLEEMGYERPAVEEVQIRLGYTTCYFRRQPEHIPGLNGVVVMPTSPNRRLGVLLAQDGDRWVVTIGGYLGDHAPTDYQGFLHFARSLPAPHIYDVIKAAEPLGDPVAYKFRANLRRRYEKVARFPDGYLVFGDALCSFNPIYGQGMTVAAVEAVALGECLANGHDELAKRFFAQASKIIDTSWSAAVGNDLGFPEVEGPRTPMLRFLNWYVGKVHLAAHNDARVSIAFLKVINMVAPPPSIMHPRIAWRVMKGNLWPGRRQANGVEEQFPPVPELVPAKRQPGA
jgi:2-polyprenyl-6-methoxyphenol hydroxylase-like FAD-dependent oxidoreductase